MKSPLRLLWLLAFPAEVAAGWLAFLGPGGLWPAAIPLHLLAAALFGYSLMTTVGGHPRWVWPLLGGLLALLGFPLVGMLASAVAFTLMQVVSFRGAEMTERLQTTADTDERPTDPISIAHEVEIGLLDELEIEPVVDVLREDDPELKRAAIEAIVQQRTASSVRLLRSLLHDASPEARFFSSIGLSKLEDEISRAILAAQRDAAEPSASAAVREHLAQFYLDYAVSGFLEGVTREYYLDLARQTFEAALPSSADPNDVRRRLAQVHLLLGNIADAALLLEDLAAAQPDEPDLHLLRMEVIFQFGDFRELVRYAQRAEPSVGADHASSELVEWWASTGRAEASVGH